MKYDAKNKKGLVKAVSLLIVAFAILTINYRSSKVSWIESAVITLFSPIQSGVTTLTQNISTTFERYYHLMEVEKNMHALKKKNERLFFENNEFKERVLKYQRMETLFALKETIKNTDLILANVIGFDASGWANMLIIDQGSNALIKKNGAIITYKGLVGRAVEPMSNYSKVLLLTDARSAVDALLQRSRDRGVVVGTNREYCEMKYLSVNADVVVGDNIITSGMGGTIRKGLLIGTVTEVLSKKGDLFKRVKIALSADMSRLEEVFAILGSDTTIWKDGEPR